jgi:hypothetical protein
MCDLIANFLGLSISGDLTAGDAIVGGATLALAFFTWRLARQTRKDVELTRESIDVLDMPYVIASPQPNRRALEFEVTRGQEWGLLHLRLWNIGKGPAIVSDVRLEVNSDDLVLPLDMQHAVAAGTARDTGLELSTSWPDDGAEEPFDAALTIYYSHASGPEYMTQSIVNLRNDWGYCRSFARSESDGNGRPLADPPDR